MHSLDLRGGELYSISLKISICIHYLKFFCMGHFYPPSLFIYLFNHVFKSEWIPAYLFYTLGYYPIVPYLFCCSTFSSFGYW